MRSNVCVNHGTAHLELECRLDTRSAHRHHLVPRHSDSYRLSVRRSMLGRAAIAYSLGTHYLSCGTAGQERILAQMQKGDARKARR